MKSNVEIAKEIICGYFESLLSNNKLSFGGIQELADIKFDTTNKILLEHIKAIKNIFEKAIDEIEKGDNKC